jgi:hypothetical protein
LAVLVRGFLVAGVAALLDPAAFVVPVFAADAFVFAADVAAVAFVAVLAAVDFAAVVRVAAGFSASLFADVAAFVVAIRLNLSYRRAARALSDVRLVLSVRSISDTMRTHVKSA